MAINKTEIEKLLTSYNKNNYNIDYDDFIWNAKRYIKAIKDRRMLCSIGSVSASGMSRTIKFLELSKNTNTKEYQHLNFFVLFKILGYSPIKDSDYFRINGCGMDMVFNTNHNIIYKLYNLGFMTKKDCEILCQKTPHKI